MNLVGCQWDLFQSEESMNHHYKSLNKKSNQKTLDQKDRVKDYNRLVLV